MSTEEANFDISSESRGDAEDLPLVAENSRWASLAVSIGFFVIVLYFLRPKSASPREETDFHVRRVLPERAASSSAQSKSGVKVVLGAKVPEKHDTPVVSSTKTSEPSAIVGEASKASPEVARPSSLASSSASPPSHPVPAELQTRRSWTAVRSAGAAVAHALYAASDKSIPPSLSLLYATSPKAIKAEALAVTDRAGLTKIAAHLSAKNAPTPHPSLVAASVDVVTAAAVAYRSVLAVKDSLPSQLSRIAAAKPSGKAQRTSAAAAAASSLPSWPVEDLHGPALVNVVRSSACCIVDVYAPWCGPCKGIAPTFAALPQQFRGVRFVKTNGDAHPVPSSLGATVTAYPTFLIFRDGALVKTFTGASLGPVRAEASAAHAAAAAAAAAAAPPKGAEGDGGGVDDDPFDGEACVRAAVFVAAAAAATLVQRMRVLLVALTLVAEGGGDDDSTTDGDAASQKKKRNAPPPRERVASAVTAVVEGLARALSGPHGSAVRDILVATVDLGSDLAFSAGGLGCDSGYVPGAVRAVLRDAAAAAAKQGPTPDDVDSACVDSEVGETLAFSEEPMPFLAGVLQGRPGGFTAADAQPSVGTLVAKACGTLLQGEGASAVGGAVAALRGAAAALSVPGALSRVDESVLNGQYGAGVLSPSASAPARAWAVVSAALRRSVEAVSCEVAIASVVGCVDRREPPAALRALSALLSQGRVSAAAAAATTSCVASIVKSYAKVEGPDVAIGVLYKAIRRHSARAKSAVTQAEAAALPPLCEGALLAGVVGVLCAPFSANVGTDGGANDSGAVCTGDVCVVKPQSKRSAVAVSAQQKFEAEIHVLCGAVGGTAAAASMTLPSNSARVAAEKNTLQPAGAAYVPTGVSFTTALTALSLDSAAVAVVPMVEASTEALRRAVNVISLVGPSVPDAALAQHLHPHTDLASLLRDAFVARFCFGGGVSEQWADSLCFASESLAALGSAEGVRKFAAVPTSYATATPNALAALLRDRRTCESLGSMGSISIPSTADGVAVRHLASYFRAATAVLSTPRVRDPWARFCLVSLLAEGLGIDVERDPPPFLRANAVAAAVATASTSNAGTTAAPYEVHQAQGVVVDALASAPSLAAPLIGTVVQLYAVDSSAAAADSGTEDPPFYDLYVLRYQVRATVGAVISSLLLQTRLSFREAFASVISGLFRTTSAVVGPTSVAADGVVRFALAVCDDTRIAFRAAVASIKSGASPHNARSAALATTTLYRLLGMLGGGCGAGLEWGLAHRNVRDTTAALLCEVVSGLTDSDAASLRASAPAAKAARFDPAVVMQTIILLACRLAATFPHPRFPFVSCLVRCSAYNATSWSTAQQVAPSLGLSAADVEAFIKTVATPLKDAAVAVATADAAAVDAPEEFIDPLTAEVMNDPVAFPASGVVVDRVTAERALLGAAVDPFSRTPITGDALISRSDLKERIRLWKGGAKG